MTYKNIVNAKGLVICIVAVISLFVACGVGLLFAGTLDNLVAGMKPSAVVLTRVGFSRSAMISWIIQGIPNME